MLSFRKAEIEDKEEIDRLLGCSGCPSLEYNFTTLFIWQNQYGMEFAIEDDVLFIRSGRKVKSYLFPCGCGDVSAALDKLLKNPVRFYSLTEEQKEILEKKCPGRFEFKEVRDMEDYIYETDKLMNLKGKKLSSKRNHINRFVAENPDWSYEAITAENMPEVREMHEKWCQMAEVDIREGLAEETDAVKKAMNYFTELKLKGGLIRTNGKVAAFSMGDPLNKNTFLVHIEKAYSGINGAYQIMNREFVIHNCEGYEFVNREDDTGDEGLRKAKLSYRPARLAVKYSARERKI